jgi:hypothetical protein
VADTRELSPAPYGLEALPKAKSAVARMFPTMNALENGDAVTKAIVADLQEIPIRVRENIKGGTTTLAAARRSTARSRCSATASTRAHPTSCWGNGPSTVSAMPTFARRACATPCSAPWGRGARGQADVRRVRRRGLRRAAHRRHARIPQVAEAAQWMRRELYDPVSKRATAIEGFKPMEPRPGETYAPQLWNTELIRAGSTTM